MKLKHPESKNPIEVQDDVAEIYLTQGWVESKKSDSK